MPGVHAESDKRPKRTLKDASLQWLREHKHQANAARTGFHLDWWMGKFGENCPLSDITRQAVAQFIAYRTTDEPSSKNNTANAYVIDLAKVLTQAARVWNAKDDPWYAGELPKFQYYPILSGRDRVLTVLEWLELKGVLEPELADMAEFSLSTMLRESNVLHLTPAHIRENAAFFKPEEMKKPRPHSVPLNQTALAVLARRQERYPVIGNGRIFTFRGKPLEHVNGAAYSAWKAAVKLSGIPHCTFHDMRRTAASWLARAGVPEDVRMRLGAWKRAGTMAGVYTHWDLESLRPWICKLDAPFLTHAATPHQEKQSVTKL